VATLVIKSIGAAGRDYATVKLWSAAIPADITAITGTNEIWRGECYNDSVFSEAKLTIGGHVTSATEYIELTAAAGEEHDGTAGTGVRIHGTQGSGWAAIRILDAYVRISKLELTAVPSSHCILVDGAAPGNILIDKIVGHAAERGVLVFPGAPNIQLSRSCFYDMLAAAAVPVVYGPSDDWTLLTCLNVTLMKKEFDTDDVGGGFRYCVVKNCAAFHFGGIGGWADYLNTDASSTNNVSSDGSAPGPNSLINQIAVDQFVSIVTGAENLHLKSGANMIDAGVDLSSLFTDDIDGDVIGTWPIGADYILVGGGPAVVQSMAGR